MANSEWRTRSVSSDDDLWVFHLWNLSASSPLLARFLSLPFHPCRPPSPAHSTASSEVTQLSLRFRYYSAVRLLAEHRSPLCSSLNGTLPQQVFSRSKRAASQTALIEREMIPQTLHQVAVLALEADVQPHVLFPTPADQQHIVHPLIQHHVVNL